VKVSQFFIDVKKETKNDPNVNFPLDISPEENRGRIPGTCCHSLSFANFRNGIEVLSIAITLIQSSS
jgi:hypothetical protein